MESSGEKPEMPPGTGYRDTPLDTAPDRQVQIPVLPSRSYVQSPPEIPETSTESTSNRSETLTDTTTTPGTEVGNQEALYLLQARVLLQRIIHKSCAFLRGAMEVFETHDAEYYSHYVWLKARLGEYLAYWKELDDEQDLTVKFLQNITSLLSFDVDIRRLSSPRNATRASRDKMQFLRDSMRVARSETTQLRDQIYDAVARQEEDKDVEITFPGLPRIEETPLTVDFDMATELDAFLQPSPRKLTSEDSDTLTERLQDKDDGHDDSPRSGDTSDSEEGWDIVARGGWRDPSNLRKHGLRAVWTGRGGYPGKIPDDIAEWLDEDGTRRGTQFIGPIKSLFWIGGYDELVQAVDDPAFTIEDEVQIIPGGAKVGYLVDRYYEDGKIPEYIYRRAMGYEDDIIFRQRLTVLTARINVLPRAIPDNPQSRTIRSMYPLSRPQSLPESVACFKVKREKKREKLVKQIRQKAGDLLESNDMWFRGLTRTALACTLAFFIPAIATKSQDNEFGPGFYATNDFDKALDYCGVAGAVMIFKSLDLRRLKVWEPTVEEWKQLITTWTGLPLSVSEDFPQQYRDADFIRGPISESPSEGNQKSHFPDRSQSDQLVAVSYEGCERLSQSLHTIIYMDD
ncbi:hypothetical protein ASPWEDRAFT_69331 [Aspergillus wentii DTO 134E9]|uniref:Uncharacterized protein n=1 Tax=Aspergillus wentii DTO 134E9 TaxID=1073089 RepID=A0A1L9RMH5_ASPWE|nr:uncharacterized protein ASPWEDRAFT_69331 [Aspergillus wentii DTO 134E9]KAI9929445.1 hypothetical protein MW887_000916 [Aspergillus wentii]OJJ36112.1 hypothetical protein ASPWEDRAFT_69331 [Aspergillus wentii DTO 134E9]